MTAPRPRLDRSLSGAELRRWYWLRSELADLARDLGVSTSGGKAELTERLVAALDGNEPIAPSSRLPTVDQLTAPLSGSTVLPARQRCTQALRIWFVDQLGPGFRFDATMRDYIAEGGHTLDEAVSHWRATRSGPAPEIGAQFELNRFSRAWHAEHPGSAHADMLSAWREHRSLPRDSS